MSGFWNQHDSVESYGTQTAPTADTAIATISASSLPAGLYEVRANVRVSAGANAGVADNYSVRRGGIQKRRILMGITAASGINVSGDAIFYTRTNGSQTLTVNAVGNESAAVIVAASISARRVAD